MDKWLVAAVIKSGEETVEVEVEIDVTNIDFESLNEYEAQQALLNVVKKQHPDIVEKSGFPNGVIVEIAN